MGVNADNRQDVAGAKRQTGWLEEKVVYKDINELMFELRCDHIIGSSSDVTNNLATVYYNSANTEFRDKNETPVTFSNGDTIAWRGLDSITSNIDISTIDDLEHVMFQGVTIALGIYDLDLGENQRGELDFTGSGSTLTVLSSDGLRIKTGGTITVDVQSGDWVDNGIIRPIFNVLSDFTSKKLEIGVESNTTVGASADNIMLLNEENLSLLKTNVSRTYNISTDLMSGTSEKNSTWYWMWIDSNLNGRIVPDLTSTATGTTANKLIDAGADFVTEKVSIGDIVYNTTDHTETTVTAIDSLTTLSLADDIFISAENYRIRMLSPDGIGEYKARIGAVYNNSSGNFDDSFYTNPNQPRKYSDSQGDYTITGSSSWTTDASEIVVTQYNDWMGIGKWSMFLSADGTTSSIDTLTITVSGVVFDAYQHAGSHGTNSNNSAKANASTNTINLRGATATDHPVYIELFLIRKPTFAV